MQETTSLEDVLDHFESEEMAQALKTFEEPASDAKSELISSLLSVADALEGRGRSPVRDILQAFEADSLERVCLALGVEPGDESEMVERLAERVGFVRWADKVFGGLEAEDATDPESSSTDLKHKPIAQQAVSYVERLTAAGGFHDSPLVSHDSKTERLLARALSSVNKRIRASRPEEHEVTIYNAWLKGGSYTAAQLLATSSELRRPWAKGNERKAIALAEIFTLAMISRWYRFLDGQWKRPEQERQFAREIAAGNVLMLFDDYSDRAVELAVADFIKLDAQFNHDSDLNEGDGEEGRRNCEEENLLGLRSLWACGVPMEIDLERATFPLGNEADRHAAGIPDWTSSPGGSVIMASALAGGTKETLKWFVEHEQAAEPDLIYTLVPISSVTPPAE